MVCIFSTNPILHRMLVLEVERQGFVIAPESEANIFIVDLDSATMPLLGEGRDCIYLSEQPDSAKKKLPSGAQLLSLPFSVTALSKALNTLSGRRRGEIRLTPEGFTSGGKKLSLSKRETALFTLLWERKNEMVPLSDLQKASGQTASNSIQVLLYRIRKKLPQGEAFN